MAQTERLTVAPDAGEITRSIMVLRGQRVLLDAELAALYRVETRILIQAVQRNRTRFPADFMFQLNAEEWVALRSQFVISKAGRGGRRYPPYAFTEQGVAMLSSVLGSERAITAILSVIRELMNPSPSKRRGIGFTANLEEKS